MRAYTQGMRGERPQSLPPVAYRVLAGLLLVGAACGVLFVVMPSDEPSLKVLDGIAALCYAVMALLVWFVLPRIPNHWGLDIAVWFTSLSTFAAVAFIDLPEGRVLTGFELVLFAVFAAYFLPLRRYILAFVVMALGYGIAVVGEPIPPVYYCIIILITASVSGFVAVLVDRLRKQATTDALTGVLNRRGLDLATAYLDRRRTTVVALVDLNDFKNYNDRYGHLAGDSHLAEIAHGLREALDTTDVTARFGGDEFTVVLPGRTVEDAQSLLQAAAGDPPLFSVGLTVWSPTEPLSAALQRADDRLYEAKARR